MKRSSFKKLIKLPFTEQEWKEIKRYRKIPFKRKLEMLDNYRSFIFQIWRENPSVYRASQKTRRLQFDD